VTSVSADIFNLQERRAIVTGGGSGLGLQIAGALASAGADILLCARDLERCEAAAKQLSALHDVKVCASACDVRSPEEIESVVSESVRTLGGVDILVNNAGTSWGAPAIDYPYEAWQKVIAVNLTGSFLFSQAAARRMIEQGGGGKIINIASVLGFRGAAEGTVDAVGYSASKGGVISMTRDLAAKWAPKGIGVNAIAPGWFRTDMSDQILDQNADDFLDRIPAGRFGGNRDLKGAAIFLASPASDYVVGQTIVVDGGLSIT
jgi:NAD(P)-dependent dehydrogenase (short-subunit alcohol dehydrogenase family)